MLKVADSFKNVKKISKCIVERSEFVFQKKIGFPAHSIYMDIRTPRVINII